MILVLQNKNIVEAHFLQDRHNKLPIHYRPGWHLLSKKQMHTGQKRIQMLYTFKRKSQNESIFFSHHHTYHFVEPLLPTIHTLL